MIDNVSNFMYVSLTYCQDTMSKHHKFHNKQCSIIIITCIPLTTHSLINRMWTQSKYRSQQYCTLWPMV